jgi:hypothetical protein
MEQAVAKNEADKPKMRLANRPLRNAVCITSSPSRPIELLDEATFVQLRKIRPLRFPGPEEGACSAAHARRREPVATPLAAGPAALQA